MNRSTIEASKFTTLDKLLQIRQDNYLGKNGQDYDKQSVDEMIALKQTNKDRQAQKKIEKEIEEGLYRKEKLKDLVRAINDHIDLFSTPTLAGIIKDLRPEIEMYKNL